MLFDEISLGNKRNGEKFLVRLLKSPSIIAGSLKKERFSNTRWLSSDSNELCHTKYILLREKQVGIVSKITNGELVAIAKNY